jgi:hypothetical protein
MWYVWKEGRGAYSLLMGKPDGRGHLEDPGVDGRVMLEGICKK